MAACAHRISWRKENYYQHLNTWGDPFFAISEIIQVPGKCTHKKKKDGHLSKFLAHACVQLIKTGFILHQHHSSMEMGKEGCNPQHLTGDEFCKLKKSFRRGAKLFSVKTILLLEFPPSFFHQETQVCHAAWVQDVSNRSHFITR